MKRVLTKREAVAFKARWSMVNQAEINELRRTSIKRKAKQLATLIASVNTMGWSETLKSEESKARELWLRLKQKHRG